MRHIASRHPTTTKTRHLEPNVNAKRERSIEKARLPKNRSFTKPREKLNTYSVTLNLSKNTDLDPLEGFYFQVAVNLAELDGGQALDVLTVIDLGVGKLAIIDPVVPYTSENWTGESSESAKSVKTEPLTASNPVTKLELANLTRLFVRHLGKTLGEESLFLSN